MKKTIQKLLTSITLLTFASTSAFAHGGKVDAQGCHMDKKVGKKHCHTTKDAKTSKKAKKKSEKSTKKN